MSSLGRTWTLRGAFSVWVRNYVAQSSTPPKNKNMEPTNCCFVDVPPFPCGGMPAAAGEKAYSKQHRCNSKLSLIVDHIQTQCLVVSMNNYAGWNANKNPKTSKYLLRLGILTFWPPKKSQNTPFTSGGICLEGKETKKQHPIFPSICGIRDLDELKTFRAHDLAAQHADMKHEILWQLVPLSSLNLNLEKAFLEVFPPS